MLASLLVPLSAFAQRERNRQDVQSAPQRAAPTPEHEFRGHVYHGRRDWTDGRWHHEMRDGRLGWWWDVGGLWYFYPEQSEGPPDYVSDIEVADEAPAAVPPRLPEATHHVFYYRPGDLKGVPYDTFEECTKVTQQAGDVGVCVRK